MRVVILYAAVLLALTSPTFAQQAIDPAFLQRALDSIANQRNSAQNTAAAQEARAIGAELRVTSLTDELAKAQARIKELEAPTEPKE